MKKGAFDYKSKYCEYGFERTKKLNVSNKNTFRSVVTTREENTNHLYSCLSCDYMKCFFSCSVTRRKTFSSVAGIQELRKQKCYQWVCDISQLKIDFIRSGLFFVYAILFSRFRFLDRKMFGPPRKRSHVQHRVFLKYETIYKNT